VKPTEPVGKIELDGVLLGVIDSVTKGYDTFLGEMTRVAKHAADRYRSESGKLTAKPRHEDPR
jgi:hypothetical protein